MKFSSQEEYGLRCLLEIARLGIEGSMTIPEISRAQNLTTSHVAKLMAILRRGGFVTSTRGQAGGYTLARPANEMTVGSVLRVLGGRLYEDGFCERHSNSDLCTGAVQCSLKALWSNVQDAVDSVLERVTVADILVPDEPPALVQLQNLPSKADRRLSGVR